MPFLVRVLPTCRHHEFPPYLCIVHHIFRRTQLLHVSTGHAEHGGTPPQQRTCACGGAWVARWHCCPLIASNSSSAKERTNAHLSAFFSGPQTIAQKRSFFRSSPECILYIRSAQAPLVGLLSLTRPPPPALSGSTRKKKQAKIMMGTVVICLCSAVFFVFPRLITTSGVCPAGTFYVSMQCVLD